VIYTGTIADGAPRYTSALANERFATNLSEKRAGIPVALDGSSVWTTVNRVGRKPMFMTDEWSGLAASAFS
jgi:hypothetical protein